jgi:transcriptional regulator with XRE-family HTH domain
MAKKSKLEPYHDVRTSFAMAFSNWRQRNHIPLKKVAADLGLSIATINKWELGQRFPTGRHFELLVMYTGEPPCRLFCVMADKCAPTECHIDRTKRK